MVDGGGGGEGAGVDCWMAEVVLERVVFEGVGYPEGWVVVDFEGAEDPHCKWGVTDHGGVAL